MRSIIEKIVGREVYANLSQEAVGACEAVREYYTSQKKLKPDYTDEMQAIKDTLQEQYDVTLEEVMRHSRKRENVELRGIVWVTFKNITGYGIGEMERIFGWNHSTIYHNIEQVYQNTFYKDFERRFNKFKEQVNNKLI